MVLLNTSLPKRCDNKRRKEMVQKNPQKYRFINNKQQVITSGNSKTTLDIAIKFLWEK
jgi:hypothetical protein